VAVTLCLLTAIERLLNIFMNSSPSPGKYPALISCPSVSSCTMISALGPEAAGDVRNCSKSELVTKAPDDGRNDYKIPFTQFLFPYEESQRDAASQKPAAKLGKILTNYFVKNTEPKETTSSSLGECKAGGYSSITLKVDHYTIRGPHYDEREREVVYPEDIKTIVSESELTEELPERVNLWIQEKHDENLKEIVSEYWMKKFQPDWNEFFTKSSDDVDDTATAYWYTSTKFDAGEYYSISSGLLERHVYADKVVFLNPPEICTVPPEFTLDEFEYMVIYRRVVCHRIEYQVRKIHKFAKTDTVVHDITSDKSTRDETNCDNSSTISSTTSASNVSMTAHLKYPPFMPWDYSSEMNWVTKDFLFWFSGRSSAPDQVKSGMYGNAKSRFTMHRRYREFALPLNKKVFCCGRRVYHAWWVDTFLKAKNNKLKTPTSITSTGITSTSISHSHYTRSSPAHSPKQNGTSTEQITVARRGLIFGKEQAVATASIAVKDTAPDAAAAPQTGAVTPAGKRPRSKGDARPGKGKKSKPRKSGSEAPPKQGPLAAAVQAQTSPPYRPNTKAPPPATAESVPAAAPHPAPPAAAVQGTGKPPRAPVVPTAKSVSEAPPKQGPLAAAVQAQTSPPYRPNTTAPPPATAESVPAAAPHPALPAAAVRDTTKHPVESKTQANTSPTVGETPDDVTSGKAQPNAAPAEDAEARLEPYVAHLCMLGNKDVAEVVKHGKKYSAGKLQSLQVKHAACMANLEAKTGGDVSKKRKIDAIKKPIEDYILALEETLVVQHWEASKTTAPVATHYEEHAMGGDSLVERETMKRVTNLTGKFLIWNSGKDWFPLRDKRNYRVDGDVKHKQGVTLNTQCVTEDHPADMNEWSMFSRNLKNKRDPIEKKVRTKHEGYLREAGYFLPATNCANVKRQHLNQFFDYFDSGEHNNQDIPPVAYRGFKEALAPHLVSEQRKQEQRGPIANVKTPTSRSSRATRVQEIFKHSGCVQDYASVHDAAFVGLVIRAYMVDIDYKIMRSEGGTDADNRLKNQSGWTSTGLTLYHRLTKFFEKKWGEGEDQDFIYPLYAGDEDDILFGSEEDDDAEEKSASLSDL
jgi:hypothetical protein